MPDVQIRTAIAADISTLMAIDHTCQTDYVWQMNIQNEAGQNGAIFREIRLPRSVTVTYPRQVGNLTEFSNRQAGMLVAVIGGQTVGYVRTIDLIIPQTAWLMDLVIAPRFRRQGIASALVMAAQSWAAQREDCRVMLEMPSKNNPAIRLAQKLGFEFCGYNDQYYETKDIVLFFGRSIR
jgi:ribosomal protein S18 acetylase RimI-like enzyme